MNKLRLEDRIRHLERLRIANRKNIDFLETLWRTNKEPAVAQNIENREECSSAGEYRHNKIVELKNEPRTDRDFDVENICGSDSDAEEVDKQMCSYFREPTQSCLRLSCQTLHEYNELKKQRAEEEAIIAGGCGRFKANPIPAHVLLPLYSPSTEEQFTFQAIVSSREDFGLAEFEGEAGPVECAATFFLAAVECLATGAGVIFLLLRRWVY
ncbi:hypothetical protein SprV_0401549600 [Sparganum proliferum]